MILRVWLLTFLILLGYVSTVMGEGQRIISLSPSFTKMIYLLEAEDQLVGRTSFCDVAGDDKEIVASQMSINTEKILGLDPDLVITSTLSPARDIKALEQVGVPLNVMDMPGNFDDLCDQFMEIGRLTGKENRARNIIEREKRRLEDVRESIPDDENPKVFLQLGAKPLFAAIPDTFADDYINLAGGVNIASDMKQGSINRETVLARNPDAILIIMMGRTGQQEKQTWLGYPGLSAAQSDNVHRMDEDDTASPTPVTFVDTIARVIDLIYN